MNEKAILWPSVLDEDPFIKGRCFLALFHSYELTSIVFAAIVESYNLMPTPYPRSLFSPPS